MSSQLVKVRREAIAACMTCPLCNKLLKEATTIPECLHSFCRKCIYDKISEEEIECCPICKIDLGCVPLEKLRPDHHMEDLRAKIFPFKRRKVTAPELLPSTTLPMRRKERSLSSLVVGTPKLSSQNTVAGNRTKLASRKAQGSDINERHVKEEQDSAPENSSSQDTLRKFTRSIRQGSLTGQPSQNINNQKKETVDGTREGKSDIWDPLNYLVEIASRTKSVKSSPQGPIAKSISSSEPLLQNKGNRFKPKVENVKDESDPSPSEVVKPKRMRRVRVRKPSASEGTCISPQEVLDCAGARQEPRTGPIWFCLVASEEQDGNPPLPQIPSSYIRIKDGNLPVSFIHKYLMKKLQLRSENEVEIKCLGQTVIPTLLLYNLVDLWLQTASTSQRVPAVIGSSAKDFIMVLTYSRKVLHDAAACSWCRISKKNIGGGRRAQKKVQQAPSETKANNVVSEAT